MKLAIRSMFRAPKGKVFVAFDLSQAETWIVAHKANEYNMIDALKNGDIHCSTAVALFHESHLSCPGHRWDKKKKKDFYYCEVCDCWVAKDQRYLGKKYNHASAYRMGFAHAATTINKESPQTGVIVTTEQSRVYQSRWHGFYSIKGWWADIEYQLNVNRTIRTVYGRKRTFFAAWGDELFKEATAYEPQSTVADHAFGAVQPELGVEGGMLGIHKHFKNSNDVRLVHTAHDSAILETPYNLVDEVSQICYRNMHRPLLINGHEFYIPVDGEVGERWGEMEGIKREILEAA
jgi:DNA polymerase I-like protein with 3'-5' exonuclease and polymerase domains